MAKYTAELGEIVKSGVNIFNFNYPFYDESKKKEFEEAFINKFYTREIGQETVGRFIHFLKVKLNEIMPYYNMLYRTSLLDYEILVGYNIEEEFSKAFSSNNNTTGKDVLQGGTTANESINGTSITDATTDNTINKNSEVESDSTKTNNVVIEKSEKDEETTATDTTDDKTTDIKIIKSDTPQSLLSMEDIKNNVYATSVDIQDNGEFVVGSQTSERNKEVTTEEETNQTQGDKTKGKAKDTETQNYKEKKTDTANTNTNSNSSVNSTSDKTLNALNQGNETYTRKTKGFNSSVNAMDLMKQHMELQRTLTTITNKVFDECQDLFMLIY